MLIVTQKTKRKEERNERKNNSLDILAILIMFFDMYTRHWHEFYSNNFLKLKKIHHRVEYLKMTFNNRYKMFP